MSEYIELEVVLNAITADGFEHFSGCLSSSEVRLIELMRDSVSEIPVSDVAPVVRGRWVKHNVDGTDMFGEPTKIVFACNCSVCGLDGRSETPYCPNCGARMDGE